MNYILENVSGLFVAFLSGMAFMAIVLSFGLKRRKFITL